MAVPIHREENQVLFEEKPGVRKVILNRPKKLNSLNFEMISIMLRNFQVYENDPTVKLVILKGNGKSFCAGGDVVSVINCIRWGHWSLAASFYRKQLSLDYLLATYKNPLVSLIHGIVMGGGAGLSMHTRYRIVTENTVFAMPEVSIGLFPDVGASFFLSRLSGFFGEYLGLTGARINGTEMLACGLATHFVPSENLASLENALHVATSTDEVHVSNISNIINKFADAVHLKQDSPYKRLEVINKCFSGETVEKILSSLKDWNAKNSEKWSTDAIKSMKSASPTGLKLFLRSIREGRRAQTLEQCLTREFIMVCHVLRRTVSDDFFEGSRAMLLEKDKKPQWMPSRLELVNDEMISQYFSEIVDDDWEPLQLPARSNRPDISISRL